MAFQPYWSASTWTSSLLRAPTPPFVPNKTNVPASRKVSAPCQVARAQKKMPIMAHFMHEGSTGEKMGYLEHLERNTRMAARIASYSYLEKLEHGMVSRLSLSHHQNQEISATEQHHVQIHHVELQVVQEPEIVAESGYQEQHVDHKFVQDLAPEIKREMDTGDVNFHSNDDVVDQLLEEIESRPKRSESVGCLDFMSSESQKTVNADDLSHMYQVKISGEDTSELLAPLYMNTSQSHQETSDEDDLLSRMYQVRVSSNATWDEPDAFQVGIAESVNGSQFSQADSAATDPQESYDSYDEAEAGIILREPEPLIMDYDPYAPRIYKHAQQSNDSYISLDDLLAPYQQGVVLGEDTASSTGASESPGNPAADSFVAAGTGSSQGQTTSASEKWSQFSWGTYPDYKASTTKNATQSIDPAAQSSGGFVNGYASMNSEHGPMSSASKPSASWSYVWNSGGSGFSPEFSTSSASSGGNTPSSRTPPSSPYTSPGYVTDPKADNLFSKVSQAFSKVFLSAPSQSTWKKGLVPDIFVQAQVLYVREVSACGGILEIAMNLTESANSSRLKLGGKMDGSGLSDDDGGYSLEILKRQVLFEMHKFPGQVIYVSAPNDASKGALFTIASSPANRHGDFHIVVDKSNPTIPSYIRNIKPNDSVGLSTVMGTASAVLSPDLLATKSNLLLLADNVQGLAAIKSLLEWDAFRLRTGQGVIRKTLVKVVYQTESHLTMPYKDLLQGDYLIYGVSLLMLASPMTLSSFLEAQHQKVDANGVVFELSGGKGKDVLQHQTKAIVFTDSEANAENVMLALARWNIPVEQIHPLSRQYIKEDAEAFVESMQNTGKSTTDQEFLQQFIDFTAAAEQLFDEDGQPIFNDSVEWDSWCSIRDEMRTVLEDTKSHTSKKAVVDEHQQWQQWFADNQNKWGDFVWDEEAWNTYWEAWAEDTANWYRGRSSEEYWNWDGATDNSGGFGGGGYNREYSQAGRKFGSHGFGASFNFYSVLGVSRSADLGEIKLAYRKLAIKYHPDRNPNNPMAEEEMKKISLAYMTLKDVVRRDKYDAYGDVGF